MGRGNVRPGAVWSSNRPRRIVAVCSAQSVGDIYGADRKVSEAIERIPAPSSGIPVTPSTGKTLQGCLWCTGSWLAVRCWGYAERNLMATELWPVDNSGLVDKDKIRLQRSIERAGPETLLVVVGSSSGVISDSDLMGSGSDSRFGAETTRENPDCQRSDQIKFHPLTLHSDRSRLSLTDFLYR